MTPAERAFSFLRLVAFYYRTARQEAVAEAVAQGWDYYCLTVGCAGPLAGMGIRYCN